MSSRWKWATLSIACASLHWTACGDPGPNRPPASNPTLQVHVTYPQLNGDPSGVANVLVRVTTESVSLLASTDAKGRADFDALPSGDYSVEVSKSGGGDPRVTQADVDLLVVYFGLQVGLNDLQLLQADVDQSGSVNLMDLSILRRWLAGDRRYPHVGTWRFSPQNQLFVLEHDRTVRFEATVLGDVDLTGPPSEKP